MTWADGSPDDGRTASIDLSRQRQQSPSPQAASHLATALVLGLVHAVVDAATVATVFAQVGLGRLTFDDICTLILTYAVLAFGLQGPLGALCDGLRIYRPVTLAGLGVALAGVALGPDLPWLSAVAAALGNALFHSGAGGIVLGSARGRATEAGLFVAPGAMGLAAGLFLGRAGFPCRWATALILVASALAILRFVRFRWVRPDPADILPLDRGTVLMVSALLLASTASRSMISDGLAGPWRATHAMALAITVAAVTGKALGGFLADRVGLRRLSVTAVVVLSAVSVRGLSSEPLAILATLLCQMTMGAGFAGLSNALPGLPGTAFGLSSMALLIGAMPGLLHWYSRGVLESMLAPIAWVTAGMLFLALGAAQRRAGHVPAR